MNDLNFVADKAMDYMDKISKFFKQPAEVTLIVRRPGFPEQDFMLTNDDLNEVIALVNRRINA